jgi:hypothetical protein
MRSAECTMQVNTYTDTDADAGPDVDANIDMGLFSYIQISTSI